MTSEERERLLVPAKNFSTEFVGKMPGVWAATFSWTDEGKPGIHVICSKEAREKLPATYQGYEVKFRISEVGATW